MPNRSRIRAAQRQRLLDRLSQPLPAVAFTQREQLDHLPRACLRPVPLAQALPQTVEALRPAPALFPLRERTRSRQRPRLALQHIEVVLADLDRFIGQSVPPDELEAEAERQRKALDRDFWIDQAHSYAFALDQLNARLDTPSVLTTVPMWFGLLDAKHSEYTIDVLAGPDHMTDWGMRILSAVIYWLGSGGRVSLPSPAAGLRQLACKRAAHVIGGSGAHD